MYTLLQPQILDLSKSIVALNLVNNRAELLAGIHPEFIASIPIGSSPMTQLLNDLNTLNSVGTLLDGTTPFETWLLNALHLAGRRAEAAPLRTALNDITSRQGDPRASLGLGPAVALSAGPAQDAPERAENARTRILFMASAPWNKAQLDLARESRELTHGLRSAPRGNQFDVAQEWAVRLSDIQDALLRHQPHIVHFAGHGSKAGELLVERESGAAVAVPAQALGELFSLLKPVVRCVVLNACFSEPQARAISQHVDWVVGSRRAVEDNAAVSFSFSFYRALGHGQSFKSAYQFGRNQIAMDGLDGASAFVLLARGGIELP